MVQKWNVEMGVVLMGTFLSYVLCKPSLHAVADVLVIGLFV
jgi:hypothetical protein